MATPLDISLETLAHDPSAPLDLAEIALLLARDEFSFLDVEGCLHELNALAHEARPYLRGHLASKVQGLCRFLFHEMGFRGNERDYYDPHNSYFNLVMERRLGIPISLAALTMAVGSRAGMVIHGIGLPGHFVVQAADGRDSIYFDPFHGGRILGMTDIEGLIQRATGRTLVDAVLVLQPIPLARIVQRMLQNLRAIYHKNRDWPRCIRILERMRQLNRDDVALRRELGACYVSHGQPGKAVDHLRCYLDAAGDAEDADSVRQMWENAKRTLAQWN